MEREHYLGDGVYADLIEDGAIALRTPGVYAGQLMLIFLERDQQIQLAHLIERRRRAEAEFELLTERQEIS